MTPNTINSAHDGLGREVTRENRSGEKEPSRECEIVLVADRTRGSTHRFFRDWRFEVVTSTGQTALGTVLFAVPIDATELAASGWRYDMRQLHDRPSDLARGTAVFSWTATSSPSTPNPLATAQGRAQAWLSAAGDAG